MLGGSILELVAKTLRPTEKGAKFYQDISPLLAAISTAVQRGRSRTTPIITIAAKFGFSHLRLLARLPELQQEFPGVRFTLVPVDQNDSE